jgi:hypothetical protein
VLKDEIERNLIKKDIKNDLSQLGLSSQIHNSSHEIETTSYKVHRNKSQNSILNQFNVENKFEKK